MKITMILSLMLAIASPAVMAASSTNYQVQNEIFSGGAGNGSSTSYGVANARLENYAWNTHSSTNYEVQAGNANSLAGKIPSIQSVTPGQMAKHFEDDSPTYTVTAISPDDDTLQYRLLVDSTEEVAEQSSNSLNWLLSTADVGRHTVAIEVIDPDGTVTRNQDMYVFRRPMK